MFKIRSIKNRGRKVFTRSYFKAIAICFIVTFLVGGTTISLVKDEINIFDYDSYGLTFNAKSNSIITFDFVDEFRTKINDTSNEILEKYTAGVLGKIANSVSKSNSFVFGILNAVNEMAFKDKIGSGIIILIGTIIMFLYWLFVSNVIKVGKNRFFLENRKYKDTKLKRLLFPYAYKKELNIAKIMFKRNLYTFLWSFTIIGGVIKYYSYYFIPYILAENPSISSDEAFRMSKEMTDGIRFKLFLFDLSFIGYRLIGLLSFNVFNLIYTNPYIECTKAELYMKLRKDYIKNENYNYSLLCDEYLDERLVQREYPKDKYFLSQVRMKKEIDDVNIKYSFLDIILLFFVYSFIGYIWEVLLHLFSDGVFVNRGTLYGPWLPIYGFGGILSLLLLKKYSKNIGLTFTLSMFLCGVIEYFTSWYLEALYNTRWWDYTGYLFNINGRICLEGLLVFGLGCSFSIYILSPLFKRLFEKIKYRYRVIIATLLLIFILIDFGFYVARPNQGEGISLPSKSESNQIYTK